MLVIEFWRYLPSSAMADKPRPPSLIKSYDDSTHPKWVNTLVTVLSSTLGNIVTVVGTALLIRMIGGEAFGKAALLTTAAITLGTVTSSGICQHIIRTTVRGVSSEEVRTQVWIGTVMGQGIAGLISVGFLFLGLLQGEKLLFEYFLTGLSLHFTTSDALSKNRLIGGQRMIPLASATLVGAFGTVGLQLLGAWLNGAEGYLIGFASGTGLQAAASWLACRSALPTIGALPKKIFRHMKDRKLLEFVTLATLSACVVPLAHWINSLIAAHKANSYAEVAKLAVAMQFFNIVVFVPTVLNKMVLPKTIKDDICRDIDGSRREAVRQAGRMILYTAPILPLVWLLSDTIMSIYRFPTTDTINVVLCFVSASILACAAIPLSNYFVSQSKMKSGLIGNLAWATLYIGFSTILPGGAISTAISLLFAYAINLLIVFYLIEFGNNV